MDRAHECCCGRSIWPKNRRNPEGPFLLQVGLGGWGEGGEKPQMRHPWESQSPSPPLPGVPGPLSPLTCNKEIMLFLILYLPRMPVIFFLSESNFLLTFMPNVAKHDLCERTLLATRSLPRAPQELLAHSWAASPSEVGKASISLGPLLCSRLLLPAGGGAGDGACFPGLSASGVPGALTGAAAQF